MKLHELKSEPEEFNRLHAGYRRSLCVRDCDFAEGDIVRLRVWSERQRLWALEKRETLAKQGTEFGSTSYELERLEGFHGQELWLLIMDVQRENQREGFCILSFAFLEVLGIGGDLPNPERYAAWARGR